MRRTHSIVGLVGGLVASFMAVTGAILSVQPALDTLTAGSAAASADVADLAARVATALPNVERLTRSASGTVVAYYTDNGAHLAAQINPATGAVLGPYQPNAIFAFVTELHRSLFAGDWGHGVAGVASALMAALAISGILLLVARMGGWRNLFLRVRGQSSQRLHTVLARIGVIGLALSAVTGAYMSALFFGFIPDGTSDSFAFPPTGSGGTPAAIDTLSALAQTPLTSLRELIFPAAGNASDVFTITTAAGQGYIDQATGAFVSFTPNTIWQQIYEFIFMLHTGQGAWALGLVLGFAALAVPVLTVTGTLVWWMRRRNAPRLVSNASWRSADTVILYGTEGNATLGFAASLHAALVAGGHRVHTAPMNSLRAYPKAERLLVLTSTYGDGAAPATAKSFLSQLARLKAAPAMSYAVLGFGDRSFPQYCAYANVVDQALGQLGIPAILPLSAIDRQSSQDFAIWGRELGTAIGTPLTLEHTPHHPRSTTWMLVERRDYGCEVQAPTAVLRFRPMQRKGLLGRLTPMPAFEAGDLVGILPPGSHVARYYSLATSRSDGVLEIVVRKQAGGLCSEFLHGLRPGETVNGFIRANTEFRPHGARRPLILIGAGAGIAPLMGFIRHNQRRPAYLFFGARHPNSDFLYHEELQSALDDGRLTGVETAFSRLSGGGYVQDRVLENTAMIRKLVKDGAQIMVCGGLDMATGVRDALAMLLAGEGISLSMLRAEGRYVEDAY